MQKLIGLEYKELPLIKQEELLNKELGELIKFIEEIVSYETDEEGNITKWYSLDVYPDIADEIVEAIKEVERNSTPWFFGECLMEKAREKLQLLALEELQNKVFVEGVSDDGYEVVIV
jgi:hypothetical protein